MEKQKSAQSQFPSSAVAAEYGLTVAHDVNPSDFNLGDLEPVHVLEHGEECIDAETLCGRAIALNACMGLVDAKKILDNQTELPAEFARKRLVFPGTVVEDANGDLRYPCLYYGDGSWNMSFDLTDLEWYWPHHFVRIKQ